MTTLRQLRTRRHIRVERLVFTIDLVDEVVNTPPASVSEASEVAHLVRRGMAVLGISTIIENFGLISLDSRGNLVGFDVVAQGTLTSCLVHPREVFGIAIAHRAAHVVVWHNHPSGDASPSPEDITLTERLTQAGELLGIPVVDHVIVTESAYFSIGAAGGAESFSRLALKAAENRQNKQDR